MARGACGRARRLQLATGRLGAPRADAVVVDEAGALGVGGVVDDAELQTSSGSGGQRAANRRS
jgi:hypothetical protein